MQAGQPEGEGSALPQGLLAREGQKHRCHWPRGTSCGVEQTARCLVVCRRVLCLSGLFCNMETTYLSVKVK